MGLHHHHDALVLHHPFNRIDLGFLFNIIIFSPGVQDTIAFDHSLNRLLHPFNVPVPLGIEDSLKLLVQLHPQAGVHQHLDALRTPPSIMVFLDPFKLGHQ